MSHPSFDEPARTRTRRRVERRIFDVPAARATLPLVQHILADLVRRRVELVHLLRERDAKAKAGSPERHRLSAAVETARGALETIRDELRRLGVVVLDLGQGQVGYPTIVNGALAYLVYRHEDQDLRDWRYRDQPRLRPIPRSWFAEAMAPSNPEGLAVG